MWKDFFYFSKNQRVAIVILLLLIILTIAGSFVLNLIPIKEASEDIKQEIMNPVQDVDPTKEIQNTIKELNPMNEVKDSFAKINPMEDKILERMEKLKFKYTLCFRKI